nr:twin-arginine translocase TatA/TatE family subunit [uncultured Campylobacter sp.]
MGSMSMGHWLVVLAIIVLLFGAKKIPELAKGLGKGIKTFKSEMESEDKPETQKVEEKQASQSESKADETVKTA